MNKPTWKELEYEFRQLAPSLGYSRVDAQWGDAGEHWRLAGGGDLFAQQRFEMVVRLAGTKILYTGIVRDYPDVLNEPNPVTRWYKAIRYIGGNFKFGFLGEMHDNDGNATGLIYTGSIDRVIEASSLLCYKLDGLSLIQKESEDRHMNVGETLKEGLNSLFEEVGQTIIVHSNWGLPDSTSFEVRGLKNSNKGRPDEVHFDFLERIDIKLGTVLQVKGGNDYWRVIDTEDQIIADVYIKFTAKVVKISESGSEIRTGNLAHAVFNAPVYGAVQVGGQQNSQSVNVSSNSNIDEAIKQLIEILKNSSLHELDKEDAIEALNRMQELSKKEPSPGVLERVGSRFKIVTSIIQQSQELAQIAAPFIDTIKKFFA